MKKLILALLLVAGLSFPANAQRPWRQFGGKYNVTSGIATDESTTSMVLSWNFTSAKAEVTFAGGSGYVYVMRFRFKDKFGRDKMLGLGSFSGDGPVNDYATMAMWIMSNPGHIEWIEEYNPATSTRLGVGDVYVTELGIHGIAVIKEQATARVNIEGVK